MRRAVLALLSDLLVDGLKSDDDRRNDPCHGFGSC